MQFLPSYSQTWFNVTVHQEELQGNFAVSVPNSKRFKRAFVWALLTISCEERKKPLWYYTTYTV
jgi:hypothetical protein